LSPLAGLSVKLLAGLLKRFLDEFFLEPGHKARNNQLVIGDDLHLDQDFLRLFVICEIMH